MHSENCGHPFAASGLRARRTAITQTSRNCNRKRCTVLLWWCFAVSSGKKKVRTNKHLQLKECNTVLVHNGIFCKLCARNCFEDDFIKNAVSSGKGRLIRIIFFDYFNGVKRFCEFLRFFVHPIKSNGLKNNMPIHATAIVT